MIPGLRQIAEDLFYGPLVLALGLAIVTLQVVVLVMAVRRRRGRDAAPLSLKVHAIAGGWIAVFPVVIGISINASRSLMFRLFSGGSTDPGEKGEALGRGLSGQMSGIPFGVSVILLALLLWGIGLSYTLSAPRSDDNARRLPPAALVGLGLLPVALGAIQWAAGMIKTFGGLAGLPPEEKGPLLESALGAGRAQLAQFARISMFAIAILAVVALVLIVLLGRAPGEGAQAPRRSPRLPLAVAATAIVLAALLILGARPMAAENELPWPPTTGSQFVDRGGPPTPDLVGPDAPERAAVVGVFRDRLTLDGFAANDFEELESKLGTLRNNFKLLHPGDDFSEMALIEADAATPIARLASVLGAVRGARYYRPMFAFTRMETHVRPLFGKLERVVVTGARFRLAYSDDDDEDDWGDWKNAVRLPVQDFADYGALAQRLVELRRAGKPAVITIERASQ